MTLGKFILENGLTANGDNITICLSDGSLRELTEKNSYWLKKLNIDNRFIQCLSDYGCKIYVCGTMTDAKIQKALYRLRRAKERYEKEYKHSTILSDDVIDDLEEIEGDLTDEL